MSQPYIGEIRMFGGNFAPAGWAFCDGQTVPISENDTLFQLIGTMYGGDGEETFNLPNLQSRVPVHYGNGFQQAQTGGVEQVALTVQQIPSHTHFVGVATTGQVDSPLNAILASATSAQTGVRLYSTAATNVTMNAGTVSYDGGSQPHTNLQPSLCVNFIISLFGIFPQQT